MSYGCPTSAALRAQRALEAYLFPEAAALAAQLDARTGRGFARLNAAVARLVDEWSMVAYCALDYSDEESVGDVLAQVGGPLSGWEGTLGFPGERSCCGRSGLQLSSIQP